jgi:hypothetical protein
MSRRVFRLGQVEVAGALDWPAFIPDGARAYAREHKAKSHIQLGDDGEHVGFYFPEPLAPGEKPFKGGVYSAAGLVYFMFAEVCRQSQRNIEDLDVVVVLPCDGSDEICWVRMEDGSIAQDLILLPNEVLDRIQSLPAYFTVYSALSFPLQHADVRPLTILQLIQVLPRKARVRSPALQLQVNPRVLLIALLALLVLAGLGWGGWLLYQSFKPRPKATVETLPDQTADYQTMIEQEWKTGADRGYALQFWADVRTLPVAEEGWARQRISCKPGSGCVTTWNRFAGDVDSLARRYTFNPPEAGSNTVTTQSPLKVAERVDPVVTLPNAEVERWATQARAELVKLDPKAAGPQARRGGQFPRRQPGHQPRPKA